MPDSFEHRYHDLAVVTCEWRAFGVDDPETMAADVFARLRAEKRPPDLKLFYKCVEAVVDHAYRVAAGKKPIIETIFAAQAWIPHREQQTTQTRIRSALAGLPMREADLLRQAFWDDLTPVEMADANNSDPATQQTKLATALAHFAARLPAGQAGDPEAAMRDIHPGEHRRAVAD